ncbi:unnamed protein product [Ectocarpus fasciculatus]
MKAGADIEARSSTGRTPLFQASDSGACGIMLVLLQLGADVHARDCKGNTPLHQACDNEEPDAVDLLLRWGADETAIDNEGNTPHSLGQSKADEMEDIDQAGADRDYRRKLERLSKLLTHAPQDRSWRRRGFLVMCRTHQNRLRLVVEVPDTAATAIGQTRKRPTGRGRRVEVKVEVEVGGAHAHGRGGGTAVGSGTARPQRRSGGGEGADGSFDVVAAWLTTVPDEDVFRKIVGFL